MARSTERLDSFYDKMKFLHKKYVPDWRFGQLMVNFIGTYGDPFYFEEDRFLEKIETYLKEVTGNGQN